MALGFCWLMLIYGDPWQINCFGERIFIHPPVHQHPTNIQYRGEEGVKIKEQEHTILTRNTTDINKERLRDVPTYLCELIEDEQWAAQWLRFPFYRVYTGFIELMRCSKVINFVMALFLWMTVIPSKYDVLIQGSIDNIMVTLNPCQQIIKLLETPQPTPMAQVQKWGKSEVAINRSSCAAPSAAAAGERTLPDQLPVVVVHSTSVYASNWSREFAKL